MSNDTMLHGYVSEVMNSLAALALLVLGPSPPAAAFAAGAPVQIDDLLARMEHLSTQHDLRGLTVLFRLLRRHDGVWPHGNASIQDRVALSEWTGNLCTYLLGGRQGCAAPAVVQGLARLSWIPPLEGHIAELVTTALLADAPRLQRTTAPAGDPWQEAVASADIITITARCTTPPTQATPSRTVSASCAQQLIHSVESQLLPAAAAILQVRDNGAAEVGVAVQRCISRLQPVALALDELDLPCLQVLCTGYNNLLCSLRATPQLCADDAHVVGMWPLLLIDYLQRPQDARIAGELVRLLHPHWLPRDGNPSELQQSLQQLHVAGPEKLWPD